MAECRVLRRGDTVASDAPEGECDAKHDARRHQDGVDRVRERQEQPRRDRQDEENDRAGSHSVLETGQNVCQSLLQNAV